MRTSKIAQETARITKALASSTGSNRPQRRSLRQYQRVTEPTSTDSDLPLKHGSAEDSGSELSSPPSSSAESSLSSYDDEAEPTSTSSRKRKRGSHPSGGSAPLRNSSENIIRRTPRRVTVKDEEVPKKARRQPAKRIKGSTGTIKVEPPLNWEEVYDTTAEMRKRVLAPVDTMGCESLAEDDRSPRDRRLQTLIALMLSSQTKDTVTAVAMRNLQANLPGGFCLESLLTVEPEMLNDLIMKVGFHNNKTKYIKATAEILKEKFAGDIPDTIEGMISLPGVGPKMAYLCMSSAWGRDEGIGVDVHVHRITNLWGWHKTKNPEETRAELEAWLPKEKWHDINHLLVGFGQTICLPIGRKCGECTLSVKRLCPSAVVLKEVKKRVKKETTVKGEQGEEVVKEEMVTEVGIKLEKADDEAPPLDVGGRLNNDTEVADIEGLGAGADRPR